MSEKRDPRVDAYIEQAAEFARPILRHLRAVVHRGCPDITEAIKWGMPHFEYQRAIVCGMAAFKAHCAFGFNHHAMEKIIGDHAARNGRAMGNFGRITTLQDLPGERALVDFVRHAVKLIDAGVPARPRPGNGRAKPAARVPADLAAALKKNPAAAKTFAGFSPSHRREYIEWIAEAKREETRRKRLATTLEWLTAGKPRHWKYRNS